MEWARNCPASACLAAHVRVKTTSPLVSLSMRCTTPRFARPPRAPKRSVRSARSRLSTVSSSGSSKGTVEIPAGLSTTTSCASAKTTGSGSRTARLSMRGAFRRIAIVAFGGTFRVPSVHTTPSTVTFPRSMAFLAAPQLPPRCTLTCRSSGDAGRSAENVASICPLQHGFGAAVEPHCAQP